MNSASMALTETEPKAPKKAKAAKAAKPARARKGGAKKAKAATAADKPARRARGAKIEIPALDDLRLAPGGIQSGGKRNKYVEIAFANGFVVRLLPVNMPKTETLKVRDLMADWLNRRLAAN